MKNAKGFLLRLAVARSSIASVDWTHNQLTHGYEAIPMFS